MEPLSSNADPAPELEVMVQREPDGTGVAMLIRHPAVIEDPDSPEELVAGLLLSPEKARELAHALCQLAERLEVSTTPHDPAD